MNCHSIMRWFRFPRIVRPGKRPGALFWWEGELGPIWRNSPHGTDMQRHYVRLCNGMQTATSFLEVLYPRRRAGALVVMTGSRMVADNLVAHALKHGHSKAEARALIQDIRTGIKHRIQSKRRLAAMLPPSTG